MLKKNDTIIEIFESWSSQENEFNSTQELLKWIKEQNNTVHVNIKKINLDACNFWYYDKDNQGIINRNKSFFQIKGIVKKEGSKYLEQPIIIQDEIGYLGIICKKINGILYLLMQAKIEPGNINKIQISPTIQATKSNFMQAHGGKAPAYLEYFYGTKNYEIIVDQIQSEQSSMFWGKRNRNIVIKIDDDIELLPTHRWMTLGQIKQLMHYDNLVNMDTRTVIACIPFALKEYTYKELVYIKSLFTDESLYNSLFYGDSGTKINKIFQYMNEYKMLNKSIINIVDLYSLTNWKMGEHEFSSPNSDLKIVFCDIEVNNREVSHWQQPLFEAVGESTFALIYFVKNNIKYFLVHAISEIGCFDKIEIGPSIQKTWRTSYQDDVSTKLFVKKLENNEGIKFSGLFSEEGGRFYHESNRNIIMEVSEKELPYISEGYFWADFQTLNTLIQFNNCLNIQLRNLLSLLEL